MKRCFECQIIKSNEDFGKDKYRKDGLKSNCKDCASIKNRNNYNPRLKRIKYLKSKDVLTDKEEAELQQLPHLINDRVIGVSGQSKALDKERSLKLLNLSDTLKAVKLEQLRLKKDNAAMLKDLEIVKEGIAKLKEKLNA